MPYKKLVIILIYVLLYQSLLFSKSNSFEEFNSKNLSKYFSGIIAFEDNNNSEALKFFSSSKNLLDKHEPYKEKYIKTLILENRVSQAIQILKTYNDQNNFEFQILLALDSIKKKEFTKALNYLSEIPEFLQKDRFNFIVLHSLKNYILVFKKKKIPLERQNFGNLSLISETFQKCYLGDENTNASFLELINKEKNDYSRYIYFYLTHLLETDRLKEAKEFSEKIEYINTSILISQGKSWIENDKFEQFSKIFSCKNHTDVLSEFLFLISNLYSTQEELEKSNFYLSLSNYLNPNFTFNLSLAVENLYVYEDYDKIDEILKKFNNKEHDSYYWYRLKKEAQIISKLKNKEKALNHIITNFKKIKNPNDKILFDVANFYKNSKKYDLAIDYYTQVLQNLSKDSKVKSEILYRRGGSYERLKKYNKADNDLIKSLEINPEDAYVLNYLAYSWLERDYKIDEAIQMLEKAYRAEQNNPYIIDSIGWAYYLINDFVKAEEFLKRAVELMPNDPIVNDHYGDILWQLNRKIQARYFWTNVLKMEDVEDNIIKSINVKLIEGLKSPNDV